MVGIPTPPCQCCGKSDTRFAFEASREPPPLWRYSIAGKKIRDGQRTRSMALGIWQEATGAIPTKFDGQLAEIDDLAGCIMIKLRTLHHAGANGDTNGLRDLLEAYVDAVMTLAKEGD